MLGPSTYGGKSFLGYLSLLSELPEWIYVMCVSELEVDLSWV